MPKDMRTWIDELDKAGELVRIAKPVDPHTQMGALLYQSREKALLFENLAGFPKWKSLGMAPANLRHAALAYGTTVEKLIPTAAQRALLRHPTELVRTGPVKEVILKRRSGRSPKTPGARRRQRGDALHRVGTHDRPRPRQRRTQRGVSSPTDQRTAQAGRAHRAAAYARDLEQARGKNEPMPIAIFIGHHPLYYMAAATTGAFEMDELELAGGLIGEPARVVKCETNDLEVPYDAEIVLEGRILPNVREEEGPFSEFHDYYVAGMGKNPVIEIDCITMRHDAIFKAIQNGSEVEGCIFHKVPFGVAVYNHIKNIGGYVNLHNLLVLPGLFGIVVQMTPRFYGEAKQVLMGVLSSPILHPKVAIAVDEDVNIFNYWEVLWAINTRCNPSEDITVIPGVRMHPMDPTGDEPVPPGGPFWHRVGGKVIIDATKPPLCAGDAARLPFQRLKPMDGRR
jgi:2,5-furandicarboxylate decarboxylase 1